MSKNEIASNLEPMMIAKYLFYNATDMSNLKLQKLLFFAYKEYYIEHKKDLFEDKFEAWVYGPVFPDVYKNFHEILADTNFEAINKYFVGQEKVTKFLDDIIAKYDNFSAFELVKKTHEEKSWIEARKNLGPFESSSKKMNIKKYYKD